MNIDSSIFKAYDIRGIVPAQIDAEFARSLGLAYSQFLASKTLNKTLTVCVGKDNRLSSDELTDALITSLQSQGINVIDIGLTSTPLFDFVVFKESLDGGIMVTASHNPPEYNGFKMMGPGIIGIGSGSGMEEIQERMGSHNTETHNTETLERGTVTKKDLMKAYIDFCFELVPAVSEVSKLKVVVDTGNGVSALMVKAHFDRLPCTLIPLFFELDGTFPSHEPNPLKEENLRFLKEAVIRERADLGIALDTDGDRIIFIDEKGTMANDVTIALLAKGFLADHPGEKILYDIRSSHAVPETVRDCGGIAIPTQIGHTRIKKQMRQENGFFAGELSGHYYFRDVSNFEAPSLVINTILNLVARSGLPFSQLVEPLRKYFHTGELNYHVDDKAGAMARVEEAYSDATISHLDGVTIEYPDWWCNVRASNTENVLRLNLEANTPELRDMKRKEVERLITSQ